MNMNQISLYFNADGVKFLSEKKKWAKNTSIMYPKISKNAIL